MDGSNSFSADKIARMFVLSVLTNLFQLSPHHFLDHDSSLPISSSRFDPVIICFSHQYHLASDPQIHSRRQRMAESYPDFFERSHWIVISPASGWNSQFSTTQKLSILIEQCHGVSYGLTAKYQWKDVTGNGEIWNHTHDFLRCQKVDYNQHPFRRIQLSYRHSKITINVLNALGCGLFQLKVSISGLDE